MEKRFAIKGSNTLFLVWGIITFILTGAGLLFGVYLIIGTSIGAIEAYDYLSFYSSYSSSYVIIFIIIISIFLIVILNIQLYSGFALVRKYVKAKEGVIALAVCNFVILIIPSGFFIFLGIVLVKLCETVLGVVSIIWGVLLIAYYIITGILLIMKHKRFIPWESKSFGGSGNGNGNELDYSQPYAIIEGANGVFRGKRYRLEIGHLCRIGRDSTCDIQINHPQISHEHCTIVLLSNGKLSITDYSKNGTFYKDIQLPTGVAYDVNPGGWLALGGTDNVFGLKVYQ